MPLIINGEQIEDATLQAEMQRISQGQQQELGLTGSDGTDDDSKSRDIAKQNIIERVALGQEIRATPPEVSDDEIEDELNKTAALYGGQQAFLQRNRMSEDDLPALRERIKNYLQTEKFLDQNAAPSEPEENELKEHFENNQQRYQRPEQVRVSHIVKRPASGQKNRVYEELQNARKAILDGADFGEMADKHSDCTDEPQGDLGFFASGKMVEAFETVVFSMRKGETSPVFMTEFGYHIARLTDYKEASTPAFEEVKEQVRTDLLESRKNEARTAYLRQLREQAEVKEVEASSENNTSTENKKQNSSTSSRKKKR